MGATQWDRDRQNYEESKESQLRQFEFEHNEAELNRQFQRESQATANQYNIDMFNRTNEYNEQMYNKYQSPTAIVQQLQDAGLNPNLYASGSTANYSPAQAVGSASAVAGSQAHGASASGGVSAGGSGLADSIIGALNSANSAIGNVFALPTDIAQKQANTRLTNANAKSQEIDNARKESNDATLAASGLYMDISTGNVIGATTFDSLSSDEQRSYTPLTGVGGKVGTNLGAFDAANNISDMVRRLSDNSLATFQNTFNKTVLSRQLNNNAVMNALENMPAQQYQKMIDECSKIASEISLNENQTQLNNKQIEMLDQSITNMKNSSLANFFDDVSKKDSIEAKDIIKGVVIALGNLSAGANVSYSLGR